MCGDYLRSDGFYLFWYWPSSRQHPVNVNFFQLKCTLVVFLFVCLFIHFASELVGNVLVNQKRFLYITVLSRATQTPEHLCQVANNDKHRFTLQVTWLRTGRLDSD